MSTVSAARVCGKHRPWTCALFLRSSLSMLGPTQADTRVGSSVPDLSRYSGGDMHAMQIFPRNLFLPLSGMNDGCLTLLRAYIFIKMY